MNIVPAGIDVPEGHVYIALWVDKQDPTRRYPRTDTEEEAMDINCKNDPTFLRAYDFVRDKNYKSPSNKFMDVDTSRAPVDLDTTRDATEQPVDRVGMHVSQMAPQQHQDQTALHRIQDQQLVPEVAQPMPTEILEERTPQPTRNVPLNTQGLLAQQESGVSQQADAPVNVATLQEQLTNAAE